MGDLAIEAPPLTKKVDQRTGGHIDADHPGDVDRAAGAHALAVERGTRGPIGRDDLLGMPGPYRQGAARRRCVAPRFRCPMRA